jgi:putative endonuclease
VASTRPSAAFGRSGEVLARSYLEARGYRFVTSNWHCRAGELDLIMIDGQELVFIEVKARHGERSGRAEEAVSRSKSRKMLAAAEWFITKHPEYHELFWRCDLIAINYTSNGPPDIAHYVNAIVVG